MQNLGDITSPARPRILNWVNNSGYDCPAFGVFRVGEITESNDEGDDLIISGTIPSAVTVVYSGATYAVNSSQKVRAGEKGRCTLDFPTYAAFDTADGIASAGAVWGPAGVDFLLHKGYAGFNILGNPVNGVVAVSLQENPIVKLECKETLLPGAFATAYPMKWNSGSSVWEKIGGSTTVQVYGGSGWKGVIFGFDTTGLEGSSNISLIDAWYSPHSLSWYALGKGWSAFATTITADASHGATISVTPEGYSFTVSAVVKFGDVSADDVVTVIWSDSENEWQIQPSLTGDVGCGLTKTSGVIKVDVDSLAGDGIGASSDTCKKFKVNTGDGIEIVSDNVTAKIACGLEFDSGSIRVKRADLIGTDNGLETGSGTCALKVKAGCGITVDSTGVKFNASAVAGTGLTASGCTLSVTLTAGCGITVSGATVTFKRADAIQADGGLEAGDGTCDIRVKAGCAIQIGASGVSVKRADLIQANGGLATGSGTCDLKVLAGCGISVGASGVSVDRTALIGDGLTADSGTCDIKVKVGCGLRITTTKAVAVKLSDFVGDGLDFTTPADGCDQIFVSVGCGLELAGTPKLVKVKRADLIQSGGGLATGSGSCDLKVDLSSGSPLWSGTQTFTVVTDVSWNSATCAMTKTTKTFTFPANIPITLA